MDVVIMTEIQTDDGDSISVTTWDSEPGVARVEIEQISNVPRLKKASLRVSPEARERLIRALGGAS